jgi:hypothetical protein
MKLFFQPDLIAMVEQETGGVRAENAKWVVAGLDRLLQAETDAVIARGTAVVPELEAALAQYENENEFVGLGILAVLFRIRGEDGGSPTDDAT